MAYDGWVEFNNVELINISRTAQLADALGIDTVWITPEESQWIQDTLGGVDYDVVTNAPWYDSGYPASAEFAGIIPLSLVGLDDSTMESTPIEYIGDGGNPGRARNATLPIVANVAIIASTDRGAEFGRRWLARTLRGTRGTRAFCSGSDLTYFRFSGEDGNTPPRAHRRDVAVTRAPTITRKRSTNCSATWLSTYTWTAADPYEYSEPLAVIQNLGGETVMGLTQGYGSLALIQQDCPVYDYSPIYDPLYPALVTPPAVPDFYPDGWNIAGGDVFDRFWVETFPIEPSELRAVPIITLTTTVEARMVRVSLWPLGTEHDAQCEPLFSATITYLPAGVDFVIDGEQRAAYVWDGFSEAVRRVDSLVYGPDATPLQWTSFETGPGLLMVLDVFSEGSGITGDGEVRAALDLVEKSD